MTNPLLLALDFGGTKHAAALAYVGERQWLDKRQQLRPPAADAQADLDIVLRLARELLVGQAHPLGAVGVSFGGQVDFETGRVRRSTHVPGWHDFPLRAELEKHFGVPVSVDNDANAAALGEYAFGAGQGCPSLLYVTVSTGVGGGWIVGGRVHRGAHNLAGEIGHLTVQPDGPVCTCGRRGCVESLACGPALARAARAQLRTASDSLVLHLAGGKAEAITGELVAQAAAQGEALADEVLLAAARHLGHGLGLALTLMNPHRVILGGGVTKAGARWWAEVHRAAQANTLPDISADIVPAALGADSPLWGAVALVSGKLSS